MQTFQKPETISSEITIASRPELQRAVNTTENLSGAVILRNQWSDMKSYTWRFDSDEVSIKQNRAVKLHASSEEIDAGSYYLLVKIEGEEQTYVLPKDPEDIIVKEGIR